VDIKAKTAQAQADAVEVQARAAQAQANATQEQLQLQRCQPLQLGVAMERLNRGMVLSNTRSLANATFWLPRIPAQC
jgi:hypothetical protein